MNTKRDILIRVYLSFVFFILIGMAISTQIGKIQFKEGKYWRSISDSLTTSFRSIEPIRGNIYSSDNKLLVTSIPIYELRIDFKTQAWLDEEYYAQYIDSFCFKMSQLFKDASAKEYKYRISRAKNRKERYYLLKRNVNHNYLKAVKGFPFLRMGKYKGGLIVEQHSIRIHPFQLLAERTIGYKVPNVQGVGLEGAFDEYLAGKDGQRLMQKISGGQWIPINYDNEVEPEDGKDIISTIDVNIQDFTEEALLKALITHEAKNGCAVVMEVETGHIKAIANLKRNANGAYGETYNYAVGASTEPGSTFKLITAMILLDKGLVKLTDIIDTRDGSYEFYDRVMRDNHPTGYGQISFKEAFELSSNVAFSKLVFDNFNKNPKAFIQEIQKMSIDQPLGIGIAGEGKPMFKSPGHDEWSGITLPWMSVGYELLMTPLQMLTVYNAIANKGKMIKPLFAEEVRHIDQVVKHYETEVINKQICSKKTCEQLKILLGGVVLSGTAKNIKSKQYKIAGKTGTALVALQGSYSKDKKYQASFAGYFPADNPTYSCIVVITDPSMGHIYGSSVAAPVFKEIADKIHAKGNKNYLTKDVKADDRYHLLPIVRFGKKTDLINISSYLGLEMKMNSSGSEWVYVRPENNQIQLYTKNIKEDIVPDVRGMVLSDAIYILENLGLKVHARGVGKIKTQSLEPGSRIDANTVIRLKLS
ncbi:MAG: transpeptidase family protein [Bacteroidetes bacterium]|nr:transpeptidase family protein [Bacteroidota bacterium]